MNISSEQEKFGSMTQILNVCDVKIEISTPVKDVIMYVLTVSVYVTGSVDVFEYRHSSHGTYEDAARCANSILDMGYIIRYTDRIGRIHRVMK